MQCDICEVRCEIGGTDKGRCGTYSCENGKLMQDPALGYLGAFPISIETVPLLHFAPSGKFLQVFSKGCNFQCPGCVARTLASGKHFDMPAMSTADVVGKALEQQCLGVVSTMNEPAANYYLFRELALKARDENLLVGCSTNCYYTPETLEDFGRFVDFVNVGIKGYSDNSYRMCGVTSSEPVFRNIAELCDRGVHVEVSVMYAKGNENDVFDVARALSAISRSIPFQIMRFIPFGNAPIKLEPSIGEAEKLGSELKEYMDYVYLFNSPGTEMLHTVCSGCGKIMAEREFYGPMGSRLLGPWGDYSCDCGNTVPVMYGRAQERFEESGFMGGYRISRAFGMVHGVLSCLGVTDEAVLMDVWKDLSGNDTLNRIHHMIQQPYPYLDFIRIIADSAKVPVQGDELIGFIRERLETVSRLAEDNPGPKSYYCMGSPLFALNPGRMENNLVEFAGGISLNKLLQKEGKPGFNISPALLNELNPQSIFISGFLSRPLYEFADLCGQYGIDVEALRNNRIYVIPPSWDFGSPRWVLGLMFIADIFHPGKIDVMQEANAFYERFYGLSLKQARPNRSFHRPTSGRWPVGPGVGHV